MTETILKKTFALTIEFVHVPSTNMKDVSDFEAFMTYTAASHQGAIKSFRLHFMGAVMLHLYIQFTGKAPYQSSCPTLCK